MALHMNQVAKERVKAPVVIQSVREARRAPPFSQSAAFSGSQFRVRSSDRAAERSTIGRLQLGARGRRFLDLSDGVRRPTRWSQVRQTSERRARKNQVVVQIPVQRSR